MNWLTQEEIQAAAKKGRKQALLCSIEHWRQLSGATWRELVYGERKNLVHDSGDECPLCNRYDECLYCPLKSAGECCGETDSAYDRTDRTNFTNWHDKTNYLKKKNYPQYHREAKKMHKVLVDVYKKLYEGK